MAQGRRTSTAVDAHVGSRLRLRRRGRGLSQQRLAQLLGVTFQQVQKYERGTNRLAASTLYEVAKALETPVGFFFEGLGEAGQDGGADAETALAAGFMVSRQANSLMRAFMTMPPRLRLALVRLALALAGEGDDAGEDLVALPGRLRAGIDRPRLDA